MIPYFTKGRTVLLLIKLIGLADLISSPHMAYGPVWHDAPELSDMANENQTFSISVDVWVFFLHSFLELLMFKEVALLTMMKPFSQPPFL